MWAFEARNRRFLMHKTAATKWVMNICKAIKSCILLIFKIQKLKFSVDQRIVSPIRKRQAVMLTIYSIWLIVICLNMLGLLFIYIFIGIFVSIWKAFLMILSFKMSPFFMATLIKVSSKNMIFIEESEEISPPENISFFLFLFDGRIGY